MFIKNSHPITSNVLLTFVVKLSWVSLFFIFILVSLVYSLFFWLADSLMNTCNAFSMDALYDYVLFFWQAKRFDIISPDQGSILYAIILHSLRGLIHALFIGSIISKILLPRDIFTLKQNINVYKNEDKWELTIRVYNTSSLELLDLYFKIYLRRPTVRETFIDNNLENIEPIVTNKIIKISKGKEHWPISIPKVPYSITVDLMDGDVCYDDNDKPILRSIQGSPIYADNEVGSGDDFQGNSFLVLTVNGKISRMSANLMESHWVNISDERGNCRNIQFGHFCDIDVLPGNKPKKAFGNPKRWKGWGNFEDNDALNLISDKRGRNFLFGYGSLIDKEKLEEFFISKNIDTDRAKSIASNAVECRLNGFERCWNIAMDNGKCIPGYKRYKNPETNSYDDVMVSFLNIRNAESSKRVFGIIFELDDDIIDAIVQRERNYYRTKISNNKFKFFDGFELPSDANVWTNIGKPSSEIIFSEGLRSNKVVIQDKYIKVFEASLKNYPDEYEYYNNNERIPKGVKIVELERVDLEK